MTKQVCIPTDESGNFIFIVKNNDDIIEFFPYNIGTIHEYIKAKEEMKETNKSGAV